MDFRRAAFAVLAVWISGAAMPPARAEETAATPEAVQPAGDPAATAADFSRNGPYLGLAGTVAIYTELENELDQFDGDVDEPVGLNLRAGYRLHPNFAAEGQFEWLSEADVDFVGDGTIDEAWLLTANAKGYFLTGRVQPYALLGLGYMDVEVDQGFAGDDVDGQFAARLGGGIDIYITPHILGTLGAAYVIPDDDLHDFAYVSVVWGLGYRF